MISQASSRARSLLSRLRAACAVRAAQAGRGVQAGRAAGPLASQPSDSPPPSVPVPGSGGNAAGAEEPTAALEAALAEGLDEVKQYLGVLRRQTIAMSVKVARTERRLEDLSARLEALARQQEASGEDDLADPLGDQ